MILPYRDKHPQIKPSAFIASTAVVTGDVFIGEDTNIWYSCVIRGDVAPTRIGDRVNIQDNCTLHQSPPYDLIVEDEANVGHNAVLHSCHVKKGALIGIHATVLDGAVIGEYAMVAAGSVVPPGQNVPPKSLVMGTPAKVIRELTEKEIQNMSEIRERYQEKGKTYKSLEQNLD